MTNKDQPNSFRCVDCGVYYSEESGAYEGFTCDHCTENKKGFEEGICPKCGSDNVTKFVNATASNEYSFNIYSKEWEYYSSTDNSETSGGSFTCYECWNTEEF